MYISPNVNLAAVASAAAVTALQTDVTTLLARLSAARATLLDSLSIIAAGGAGELTAARAALLSNLDATVSTRLGSIKTNTKGTISIADASTSATAAIAAVTTAKTVIHYLGETVTNETLQREVETRVELTNTTTVTAYVGAAGTGARVLTVGYEVIEHN